MLPLPAGCCLAYLQVVDAYQSNSAVCQLPDVLGGTVPMASLCAANAVQNIPAPDASETSAGQVVVYRWVQHYEHPRATPT